MIAEDSQYFHKFMKHFRIITAVAGQNDYTSVDLQFAWCWLTRGPSCQFSDPDQWQEWFCRFW
jgi:hypothetical protein